MALSRVEAEAEAKNRMIVTQDSEEPGIVLTPEQRRSRRNRNIAIGLAVGFFVVLFYIVTIAKMMPAGVKAH